MNVGGNGPVFADFYFTYVAKIMSYKFNFAFEKLALGKFDVEFAFSGVGVLLINFVRGLVLFCCKLDVVQVNNYARASRGSKTTFIKGWGISETEW